MKTNNQISISEGKSLISWFNSIPYGVKYNFSLITLGIPSVWISTLKELKLLKDAITKETLFY